MSRSDALANAIRFLSMDAVEQAKSGHPGAPMGMADMATVLWRNHLRHDPRQPQWADRDRFVLSNGHASMLLYSLLHLSGYDVTLDDLRRFRQLDSKTAGHPEYLHCPGVETTTGPLGQGLANAVGMALAERLLAEQFNRPGFDIVDHRTWVFVGDGCLMEGISHEACSLAGTLGLGKLTLFYDDNGISIDGEVEGWFTDDTAARFRAYGWQVLGPIDGHDANAIEAAIQTAKAEATRPALIICKTTIGFGAPTKAGTESVHGAPLGATEVAAARQQLNWPHPPFVIPEEIRVAWDARASGAALARQWQALFAAYRDAHPELAAGFERRQSGALPSDFLAQANHHIESLQQQGVTVASRKASQMALEAYSPQLPELLGGSADLTGSNLTNWSGSQSIGADNGGNYLHYGVREFAMGAMMNGIALHGGFIPYGGTFLVFLDYARNAVRMAALMRQRLVWVFTHDSIGLGEDGPTHQPIEQLSGLRSTPNLSTWRPCDAVESAVAWREALLRRDGPTALALSRQNLPHQPRDATQLAAIGRGGYILHEPAQPPRAVVIATGSEVALAMRAAQQLDERALPVRVVSMPSTDRFLAQSSDYRDQVLPAGVPRIAVEAAHPDCWYRFVGLEGRVIGINDFGKSAPAEQLFQHFGITVERVVATVLELTGQSSS